MLTHSLLVLIKLVCTWPSLELLALHISIVIVEIHRLLNVRVARYPTLHHLLLHVEALNLYQILHLLLRWHILKLAFDLLLTLWRLTLFHLILHIVEDAVKIDRVQLHWHFDCWILLEMYQRCLTLFGIYHACSSFYALTLFLSDLFPIEHHQLHKSFYNDHAIVWLPSDWIVEKG